MKKKIEIVKNEGIMYNARWFQMWNAYLALIMYWAAWIVSNEPMMVTLRSEDPSSALAIFMVAPDNCLTKTKCEDYMEFKWRKIS